MRLKSNIWVTAYLRRSNAEGASAVVVRHGDDDAGAIFIKVNRLDGTCRVFGPAPAGLDATAADRQWTPCLDGSDAPEAAADAYLQREAEFDPDVWVIEIEDRAGRHFLEHWLRAV
ncbi:MAG: DUF1491 domain-containing protein [Hyphomicrobium sp.]|nr:DUF1491 domain-containing protein [Hyphomicrobium sp.]